MHTIEADYLVVGAGAMGMAFVDTLVSETEARVVLVDRNHQPGGHWTMAYPFVRLHQPSAFYGVNSLHLGSDSIDQIGWNQGLYELATAGEVCAYYDHVMRQQLLPSGRVSYFPMSEYRGDGRFTTLAGTDYTVNVARRVVDATYMRVMVPSMRPPPYPVAPGIECVPPNDLPKLAAHERYVIVGAGKTGIDTCLWLLGQGIAPDRLTWIMPRDSWLLDRATIQPGPLFADRIKASFTAQTAGHQGRGVGRGSVRSARGCRRSCCGSIRRSGPTMYRCATVTRPNWSSCGASPTSCGWATCCASTPTRWSSTVAPWPHDRHALYIDCTADGAEKRPATPIFDTGQITLQSVRGCQQIFSAALIAHVEAAYPDDQMKNQLCVPLPHPDTDLDWLRVALADYGNQLRWLDDPDLTGLAVRGAPGPVRSSDGPPAGRRRRRSPGCSDRILGMTKSALSATATKLDQLMVEEASLAAP